MVRTAQFAAEDFTSATIELIADGGPTAATLAAIARKVGAPTGSIYHRFDSRAAIIGAAWLDVQGSLREAIGGALRSGDLRGAAGAMVGWARAHPTWARFLLLNDIPALLDGLNGDERAAVETAQRALDDDFAAGLAALARGGAAGAVAKTRARFVVFDGLVALIQPYLLARDDIPAHVDETLDSLIAALFGEDAASRDAA